MTSNEKFPWESDGDLPWRTSNSEWAPDESANNAWRGHHHLEAWPEELAGPEYWLYKRLTGDDD